MKTCSQPTKLMLVDHDAIRLELLGRYFEDLSQFRLVGAMPDGSSAAHKAKVVRPHVVLLINPERNPRGAEATELLLRAAPAAHVIGCGAVDDAVAALAMLRAGARGYVAQSLGSRELLRAIDAVCRGDVFISQSVLKSMAVSVPKPSAGAEPFSGGRLSRSEIRVIRCVAEGLGNKDTAERMRMSVRTIEKYRETIKTKLNVKSIAEITKYAIRNGLCNLGE